MASARVRVLVLVRFLVLFYVRFLVRIRVQARDNTMIFKDISESVPLDTLIWCVPKHHRIPNERPKLTTVYITPLYTERRMTAGHAARDYLYGDTIEVPTVEVSEITG